MDRILLKIIGSQLVDGQSDQIELTTMGTMRDNGTAYVIDIQKNRSRLWRLFR